MNVHLNLTNPSSGIHSSEVMIFKTNLHSKKEVREIGPLLESIPDIVEWSVDTEDIDKVLRIETRQYCIDRIITLLTNAGFYCEELTD